VACKGYNDGVVGEDRTEGAQRGKEYVTVGEAAKLLGVHRNTIHHRIKTGHIRAHKVLESDREVYRVERDSLGVGHTSAHVRPLDAQRTTVAEGLSRMIAARLDEIVRDYTHELGDLREEIGAERARRQMAEERVADLEADVADLETELEAYGGGRETPQTVEEASDAEPQPASGGSSRGQARPRSWWRTRIGSFVGGSLVMVFVTLVGFVVTILVLR
jgi:excisionase family DNA binding protein